MSSAERSADDVPAIVIGSDINGLGVVRSLAREGVPVWLVDRDRSNPSMRTRYGTKLTFESLSGDGLLRSLLDLRGQFATRPVLFLTQEHSVETVSQYRARIAEAYRISMPDDDVMRRMMDKATFQALAEEHGFPVPRSVHLAGPQDLGKLDQLAFPCVLKPTVKTPSYEQGFKKAYKVEGMGEARDILMRVADAAEMIAQEWIEGGDDHIFFSLQYRNASPRAVASFTGQKLRSWPPSTGGTASCIPAPDHHSELSALTDAFFSKTGMIGLCSMEYKQDARTGRFLMIEPTVGRTDFQEEIGTLNGVNIPLAAYCGEIGKAFPVSPAQNSSAWSVSDIDRWSSEMQGQPRAFPAALRRYDALWRIDDPAPWCYSVLERVKTRLAA